MTIPAYPLTWPAGWRRMDPSDRNTARFAKKERQYGRTPDSNGHRPSWTETRGADHRARGRCPMSAPVDVLEILRAHAAGIEQARKFARREVRDDIAAGLAEFNDAIAVISDLLAARDSARSLIDHDRRVIPWSEFTALLASLDRLGPANPATKDSRC